MSSFDYCARLKDAVLNETTIIDCFRGFLGYDVNIFEKYGNTIRMETALDDINAVEVYLSTYMSDDGKVYRSGLYGGDCSYHQNLIIALDKSIADMDAVSKVINIFIHISKKISSDMLITSDVYDEILYIHDDERVWNKSFLNLYKDMI